MKVIVKHNDKTNHYLRQYTEHAEVLKKGYTVLEMQERYLPWLREMAEGVEPNFNMYLCEINEGLKESLIDEEVIIATIGLGSANSRADVYYQIDSEGIQQTVKAKSNRGCNYICCFSKSYLIDSISYVRCIQNLTHLAKEAGKPIIIYSTAKTCESAYRSTTLIYQIIEEYLEEANGILISQIAHEACKKASDNAKATSKLQWQRMNWSCKGLNEGIKKGYSLLRSLFEKGKMKTKSNSARQAVPLYDDVFYQSISPEQDIYVLLLTEAQTDAAYYEALGFQYIGLEGNYSMLLGRKSEFDAQSSLLRTMVVPEYRWNILTHPPCQQDHLSPYAPFFPTTDNQHHTGTGVYIGLVTTDDVNYMSDTLRYEDGSTRIAYMWEQVRGDRGNVYLKEQINAAITGPNPEEVIRLPQGESTATMLLSTAGGRSTAANYSAWAPEAEFLVAKVQPAPMEIQRIYGGMPHATGILQADAIIAMTELINFAAQQNRPIVLMMPFNGNIDAHDASLPIQQMISHLARRPGVTVVVPVGDEADKRHHYNIQGEEQGLRNIHLNVGQPGQNVVVVIYHWFTNVQQAYLYPPVGILSSPVDLRLPGITQIGTSTIYSMGEEISFLNGSVRMLFRIENPTVGQWRIEELLQMSVNSRLDIWISQQELNPHVILNPVSTLKTIGSSASIDGVMSVGAYDQNTMTVVRSSGRGGWEGRVIPTLITYGSNILAPCGQTGWVSVTGTLPSSGIMAGAAAALYSRFISEGRQPLPNTLIMNSIIVGTLRQFDTTQYPNPSQGYGIFNMQALNELLMPSQ